MTSIRFVISPVTSDNPEFREGDEVVLTAGTYQGTRGVFMHLQEDVKWAEIVELNGNIRSHPVAWIALAADATRRRPN
jgi:hypothetical protein